MPGVLFLRVLSGRRVGGTGDLIDGGRLPEDLVREALGRRQNLRVVGRDQVLIRHNFL